MTNLVFGSLVFIAICNNDVNAQRPLVIKHNGPVKKATRSNGGENGGKSDVIKESYTAGICKEGEDDVILYKTNYEECLKECRSRDQCTSVNMYSKTSVCRLNFQANLHTRPCPKYIYSEKSNWKLKSVDGCEHLNCDKNQLCSVQAGGAVCVPAECPQIKPLQNGVIFGNLVEIGKKRGFRCDRGYSLIGSKAITCQSDGHWSADPPTCLPESRQTQEPSSTTSVTLTTTEVSITSELTTASPLINNETKTPVQPNTTGSNKTSELTTVLTVIKDTDGVNITARDQETTTATMADYDDLFKAGDYNSHCEEESDCVQNFQECRENRCKCKFPTMYNLEFRECVKDCNVLGDTFQIFANTSALVDEVPLATKNIKSESDCTDMCLSKENCSLAAITQILNTSEDILRCSIYDVGIRQIDKEVFLYHTTYIRDCRRVLETLSTSATKTMSGTTPTSVKQDKPPTLVSASLSTPPASLQFRNNDKQSTTTTAPTATTTTIDVIASNDVEKESTSRALDDYHSVTECLPGTVFHYFLNSCISDCTQNAVTFQKYEMTKLETTDETIDISTEEFQGSVEDCLEECTNLMSCIVVVYMVGGCSLINGDVIPPSWLFLRARSDLYVRDCL